MCMQPQARAWRRGPGCPSVAGMRLGTVASILAGLAVAAGAFGAHALRDRLEPASLAIFETAARYHLIHALAAAFAADRATRDPGGDSGRAALAFIVGVVVFSGSLYALALGGPRVLGAITPLGGVAFMSGWVMLAMGFRRG